METGREIRISRRGTTRRDRLPASARQRHQRTWTIPGMVVWLVAGVGWTHAALGTNGIEPIGVSAQARARGGADVAVGDSALSQVDNPASLSLHNVRRFDFSGQICFPTARWSGPVDQAESEIKLVPIANAAVAMPINDRLTVGLALHTKAGLASRYKMQHLMIPFWDRRVVFGFGFS